MMNELILFIIILVISLPPMFILLKLLFKNSVLVSFGTIWLIVQSTIVILAFGIGKYGSIFDFIWAFPIGMSLMALGLFYMFKTIRINLLEISDKITKLSSGDLSLKFEEKLIRRKDEIGIIGQALSQLIGNLRKKSDFIEAIAGGDLTHQLELASETDILGVSMQKMFLDLTKIIQKTASGSTTLSKSSKDLAMISGTISNATIEISSQSKTVTKASDEISSRISSMASGSEELNANIQSISATSTEMSQNMSSISNAMEEFADTIKDVSEKSENATIIAKEANEKSDIATKIMDELNKSASEIGEVTEIIKEISQQTNLLALNANIEAASAGEAGKGFAVVANEIKELAKQSSVSAENIVKKVTDIQNKSSKSGESILSVSKIVTTIHNSSKAISSLAVKGEKNVGIMVNNIKESAVGSSDIAKQIEEMSFAVKELSKNNVLLTNNSRDITSNIKELEIAVNEASNDIVKVADESQNLNKFAFDQENTIAHFKL